MLIYSLLLLNSTACLKQAAPPQAATAAPITVGAVMSYLDVDTIEPAPPAVGEAASRALTERNLPPTVADTSGWTESRNSRTWLEQLDTNDSELLLLLETHAEFYSQLNGQYRWTVDVKATLASADDLDSAMVEEFEVPVFLFLYNEREREAVEAASLTIERKVGGMVEQYLGL